MTPAARKALATRKAIRAVQLRSMGWTLEAIAAALLPCDDHRPDGRHDCDRCQPMYAARSSAKRAIDHQLEQEYAAGSEGREAARRHQLSQIDLMLRRLVPQALGQGEHQQEAARTVVRYLDRRAKLLGLDAPARLVVNSELDQQIMDLSQQLLDLPTDATPTE